MKTKSMVKFGLIFLAVVLMGVPVVLAFANNLYVGPSERITALDSRVMGVGALLEVRAAYKAPGAPNTIQYPPGDLCDTRNPLKSSATVGYGVIGSSKPGNFSVNVQQLEVDKPYFVRVFNTTDVGSSVAFRDSIPFSYAINESQTATNLAFLPWRAISDGTYMPDNDGDGLLDYAEENIVGTFADNPDSDYDGFLDGFEHQNYMDPLDPYSLDISLQATDVADVNAAGRTENAMLYDVSWRSISGLTYRLEYLDHLPLEQEEAPWVEITNVTATNASLSIPVDELIVVSPSNPIGFFRVWTQTPEQTPVPANE